MTARYPINLIVNGKAVTDAVEPRLSLADFLRNNLGLTGTHVGCEQGVCGVCTVLVDGEAARACLLFAVQADGAQIETIEGLTAQGTIADLQAAFTKHHALQCGFCTPAMLIIAQDFLREEHDPNPEAITEAMSAAYCRCTGYIGILKAVAEVARARAQAPSGPVGSK